MNICVITPAPPRSRAGNRVTALRWARILCDLGHRVHIRQKYSGGRYDLMVALHARRSYPSIKRFSAEHPDVPLIVALTGTDLYSDIHSNRWAQESLELASCLIVLQAMGKNELPQRLRGKVRVIHQSVDRPSGTIRPKPGVFEVCVLGHLRPVKDPFRTAMAARRLPASSRIQVIHIGAALSKKMERRARAEELRNPRYRWIGELPRWQALRVLSRSLLMVLSSKMEGGANVVSEAIAASVPVLASHIPGSMGVLGEPYPGYFPTGDTEALASLLGRAETDPGFHRSLKQWCARLGRLVDPARERQSWERLLREFSL